MESNDDIAFLLLQQKVDSLTQELSGLTQEISDLKNLFRKESFNNGHWDHRYTDYNYNAYSMVGELSQEIFKSRTNSYGDTPNRIIGCLDSLVASCLQTQGGHLFNVMREKLPAIVGGNVLSEDQMIKVLDHVESYVELNFNRTKSILKDVLKLHGAIGLVSEDPEVRQQTEELLRDNGINFKELLERYKKD